MSTLVDIVNSVVDFAQSFDDFIHTGIYDFFVKWFAEAVKWAVIAGIKIKIAALKFAWDIASEILTSLNISEHINSAFSAIDSRTMSLMGAMKIPEAINFLLSAHVTKFVLKFIGF